MSADAKAKLRIEGENATAAAWKASLKDGQETAEKLRKAFEYAFAGISVAAIVEIGKHSLEVGDALNKAAIKAGVSGKAISELSYAAKLADVDLQALSASLRFMEKNLSLAETGSKEQKLALDALGLSVKQLKQLAPDKQFELMGDRISKLKDPADRARAATELFGKAGAELLPLFEQGAEGIRKAREEAERLGLSFNDEQLKKLSEAEDSIKKMKAAFEGLAVTLTAKVAPGLTQFFNDLTRFSRTDTKSQIEGILQLLNPGTAAAGLAMLSGARSTDRATHSRGRSLASDAAPPGFAEADAATKAAEQAAKDWKKFTTEHEKDVTDMNERIQKSWEQSSAQQGEFLGGWKQVFDETMADMSHAGEIHLEQLTAFAQQAAENIQDAFADFFFAPFKDGLKGLLHSAVDTFRQVFAQAAALKARIALFGELDSKGNFSGGILSGVFNSILGGVAGKRAGGGPVDAGMPYLVGERGPELFVPRQAGAIAPNGANGGIPQISIVTNIDARGATRDLRDELPGILRKNNDQLKHDLITGLSNRRYQIRG